MSALTHSERVAAAVPPDCRVVALLHDAIEDGHLRPWDAEASLSYTDYEALMLLSRRHGCTYADYIDQIIRYLGDPDPRFAQPARIAITVKIADLQDNLARPEGPPPGDLQQRYEKALATLQAALNGEPDAKETT